MTYSHYITRPKNTALLTRLIIVGAGIAFLLTMLFIRTAEAGNPVWPKYWVIRPFTVMPLSGALGGAFTYYLLQLTTRGRWRRALAIFISLVVYLVALCLGFIIGFDGTLWN